MVNRWRYLIVTTLLIGGPSSLFMVGLGYKLGYDTDGIILGYVFGVATLGICVALDSFDLKRHGTVQ